MILKELAGALNAKIVTSPDPERQITGGYAGDFLSFVMGKAPEGAAWFTVMANVNVAAVAHLADVAVVVICEGVHADESLIARASRENINVLETELDIYNAAVSFSELCK